MSDAQKRLLEKQLWSIANVLRGKMHADEYKNYILGFIFYKYLSEKLELYADEKLLATEDYDFADIQEHTGAGKAILAEVKKACVAQLGFFLRPSELFSYLVKKGKGHITGQEPFILEDLKNVLNTIEQTSMGTKSEDDFKGLFGDVDLTSSKLGSGEKKKNEVIVEVLALLNEIDFKLSDSHGDLLGDAYEGAVAKIAWARQETPGRQRAGG
jgi:type I restriction enzyme M protein